MSSAKSSWRTWRTVYIAYTLAGNFLILVIDMVVIFLGIFPYFDVLAPFFFFFMAFLTQIFLARLSCRWLRLCREFMHMERKFSRHGRLPLNVKLVHLLSGIYLLAALVEHAAGVVASAVRSSPCSAASTNVFYKINTFLYNNYRIFRIMDYSPLYGVVMITISVLCTYYWNFLDLLLSIVAVVLSARLRQFNNDLEVHQWKVVNGEYWREARKRYSSIVRVVQCVDDEMSQLVAISYCNNVVVICQQVLRTVQTRRNLFQKVYFGWSFGFLLGRTILSALCMADVHDQGKRSKHILFCVPSASYSFDVKRLLLQMETNSVTLRAWGLFPASRATLLTIAGTIMTYELILLQFNPTLEVDNWRENSNVTSCHHLPT